MATAMIGGDLTRPKMSTSASAASIERSRRKRHWEQNDYCAACPASDANARKCIDPWDVRVPYDPVEAASREKRDQNYQRLMQSGNLFRDEHDYRSEDRVRDRSGRRAEYDDNRAHGRIVEPLDEPHQDDDRDLAVRVYNTLSERDRKAWTMLGDGCTQSQVARALGVTQQTVSLLVKRIAQAFENLRDS